MSFNNPAIVVQMYYCIILHVVLVIMHKMSIFISYAVDVAQISSQMIKQLFVFAIYSYGEHVLN